MLDFAYSDLWNYVLHKLSFTKEELKSYKVLEKHNQWTEQWLTNFFVSHVTVKMVPVKNIVLVIS